MREAGARLVLWAARATTSPAGEPEAVRRVPECEVLLIGKEQLQHPWLPTKPTPCLPGYRAACVKCTPCLTSHHARMALQLNHT